jgi:hypothetical protein
VLTRGARLCETIIRTARARRGGVRECGRPYLARRLGCSTRQVSRYVAELRDAGRLDVTPPHRVRTPNGWRTRGVNVYRLTRPPHPAPHVQHPCRSGRDDSHVTPPLTGSGRPVPDPHDRQLIDPTRAAARLLAGLLGPPGQQVTP